MPAVIWQHRQQPITPAWAAQRLQCESMGFTEPPPSREPAALAASAAVQALQGSKAGNDAALQEFLGSAACCSLELCCGNSTLLSSGNLLAPERSTALLATGNCLAASCLAERRAKLLRQ